MRNFQVERKKNQEASNEFMFRFLFHNWRVLATESFYACNKQKQEFKS